MRSKSREHGTRCKQRRGAFVLEKRRWWKRLKLASARYGLNLDSRRANVGVDQESAVTMGNNAVCGRVSDHFFSALMAGADPRYIVV